VCYGLGLHVVLQGIADTRAGWEGAAVNEKVWQEDLETSAWQVIRRNLPNKCPEYDENDWYLFFDREGGITIRRFGVDEQAKLS
jgi:hypothetical protein